MEFTPATAIGLYIFIGVLAAVIAYVYVRFMG